MINSTNESMDGFERFILRQLTRQALHGAIADAPKHTKRPSCDLAAWMYQHCELLGIDALDGIDGEKLDGGRRNRVDPETWARFAPLIEVLSRKERRPAPSPLEKKLRWLAATLSLDPVESHVLGLIVRVAMLRPVHSLAESIGFYPEDNESIDLTSIESLVPFQATVTKRVLSTSQPLRIMGLVERRCSSFAPTRLVQQIAMAPSGEAAALRTLLTGAAASSDLSWEDFAHLGESRNLALRLLCGALRHRQAGVAILLHGAPGAGKTEFASRLVEQARARAMFVGEAGEMGDEPTRNDRIASYALNRAIAGRAGRAVLVIDEADDMFIGVDEDNAGSRKGSKAFMNRLVETTPAPAIFITNHPSRLGPAVLRRMSLAIRFPELGRDARLRIVEHAASRAALVIDSPGATALAEIPASPAILARAIQVAAISGGNTAADASFSARSVLEVVRGCVLPAFSRGISFDPSLSAADHDLAALADRLASSSARAISLCLYGLPGTGKSAFARHLAERMGMEVIEKRASDLMSKWVGETEKAIAQAFQDAIDNRAFLILDEADSLLRDRGQASHSWEVSQVNEMLIAMERHPLPFACTTNLMDRLDPATLRRFLFKIRFLPMNDSQARVAFKRSFGLDAPAALNRIAPLAPGDFALVARKAELLGIRDTQTMAAMLKAEVDAKPRITGAPMGFTASLQA